MVEYDSEAYWVSQVSWQIYYARAYELAHLQNLSQLPSIAGNIYAEAYALAYRIAPSLESVAASLDGLKGRSYYDTSSAISLASLYLGDLAHPQLDSPWYALPRMAAAQEKLATDVLPDVRDLAQLIARAIEAFVTEQMPALGQIQTWGAQTIEGAIKDGTGPIKELVDALKAGVPLDTQVKDAFFKWLGPQEASGPGSWFLEIVIAAAREVGRLITDGVTGAVDLLHGPAEAAVLPFLRDTFDEYRTILGATGEIQPQQATDIAVAAFGQALKLGVKSHALSLITELLHPTKHLGLGHLAAGLADAAGFEPVMRSAIGRRLEVALGRTTEHQARQQYRTVWADVRSFVEMFLEGRISQAVLRERLEFEGWRDFEINAYIGEPGNENAAVPYREARPIDLAYIFEDMTTPDDWILRQLIRSGFHREDAQVMMVGLRRRSMRTFTASYVSELVTTFEGGLLSQDELRGHLRSLGLRQEVEDLIVNRAAMGYFRRTATDLLAVYRDMVDKSLISITDFRVVIAGLGFQEHTIAAEVARLDARARGRLLADEKREAEEVIREFQRLLGTEYADRVRRGLVTPEAMEQVLVQAGVNSAQAAAMARIAAVRQIPALKLPEALTPEAQAQKIRDILARAALDRVKAGFMSEESALTYLVSIGVPKLEAEAEVALAVAQGLKPPHVEPPPKEAPEVREARRHRTEATVAAFQAGEFDEQVLLDRLRALGHSAVVAVSIVEQEATDRRLRLEKKAETERAKVLADVQKLEQALILGLVRARQIEAQDAVAALIAIGVEETQADLLVKRELLKAAPVKK